MSYTARLSEQTYPLSGGYVAALAPGISNGAWVSLQNYHRAWLIVAVGTMGAGATFDCALQQAQDATGTGAKAIAGKTLGTFKAITQLTQAGGDAFSVCCIELQTEELDVTNGFEHVRFQITVGGAAVDTAATLFGCIARFKPVPTTAWTEIVD